MLYRPHVINSMYYIPMLSTLNAFFKIDFYFLFPSFLVILKSYYVVYHIIGHLTVYSDTLKMILCINDQDLLVSIIYLEK